MTSCSSARCRQWPALAGGLPQTAETSSADWASSSASCKSQSHSRHSPRIANMTSCSSARCRQWPATLAGGLPEAAAASSADSSRCQRSGSANMTASCSPSRCRQWPAGCGLAAAAEASSSDSSRCQRSGSANMTASCSPSPCRQWPALVSEAWSCLMVGTQAKQLGIKKLVIEP